MADTHRPIIVGAGPVGLGAAFFLARHGNTVRLIDMRTEPSQQSKALAVNPRTLEILEPTGVTRRILELGLPIHAGHFYRQGKVTAVLSFAGIHPKYPFLVALSQTTTERLLTTALEAAGGTVERGTRLVGCRNQDGAVEVTLEPTEGGPREVVSCPWLLAADGAHSTARQQLGLGFPGSSFAGEWHLTDVPLRTALAADQAHVFFQEGDGFVFLIRVVDDSFRNMPGDPVWRVISNRPDPLSRLSQAEATGPPVWTSGFHISHRIATKLAAGQVYFAGDAAHIHSPIGARGMNLGLEDAWVFAQLLSEGKLNQYDGLRRPEDRRVVRRVELLSRIAAGDSRVSRLVRRLVFPTALRIPFLRERMVRTITGLDHDLPAGLADTADRNGGGRPLSGSSSRTAVNRTTR